MFIFFGLYKIVINYWHNYRKTLGFEVFRKYTRFTAYDGI